MKNIYIILQLFALGSNYLLGGRHGDEKANMALNGKKIRAVRAEGWGWN